MMPVNQPLTRESVAAEIAGLEVIAYERSLHPELTLSVCGRTLHHGGAQLTASITESGHRLDWVCGEARLTELVGHFHVQLPRHGRAARHSVRDGRDVELSLAGGRGYYSASHAEVVPPDVFAQLDRELRIDARKTEQSHCFCPGNRLTTPARSLIRLEPMDDSLVVHTVHTFPPARTIVRTQSLFELP